MTSTSTSSGSAGGEWVPTPIADVKDGARVRACGVEGTAEVDPFVADLYIGGTDSTALRVRGYSGTGAVIDVWVPAPTPLTLPTTPRPFWGRYHGVEGWCWGPDDDGDFLVLLSGGGWRVLDVGDVTRLPVPAAALAALAADEPEGGDDRG